MKLPVSVFAAPLFLSAILVAPASALAQSASPSTPMSPMSAVATPPPLSEEAMMKQMVLMAELNENHKLLGTLVGTWDCTSKMWMNPDPSAPPTESKGTAVRKAIMGGRYFSLDVKSKMPMPDANGKITNSDFEGMGLEGYDNVKKKFISSWIDNMGTGILFSEGTYDAPTKTFTYHATGEFMPGMKLAIRAVMKIVDNDHHVFEWYDNSRGEEAKTMEISYTRRK